MQKLVKVGDADLKVAVPDDLDGRLLAGFGCSLAEVTRLLEGHCLAGFVARALVAVTADPPPRADLAAMIHHVGTDKIRRKALAVYRAATPKKKEKEAGHDEEQGEG